MSALPVPEPLRVRPAPDSRPPLWDPVGSDAEQGWLQLLVEPTSDQPPLPLESAPVGVPSTSPGDPAGAREAEYWGGLLAIALFETLHGRRPVGQLTRWVDGRVQSRLLAYRRRSASATSAQPAVLRSIRVQQPRPEAAEVSAHLGSGSRSYAVALRLELAGGRWLCVAAEFG